QKCSGHSAGCFQKFTSRLCQALHCILPIALSNRKQSARISLWPFIGLLAAAVTSVFTAHLRSGGSRNRAITKYQQPIRRLVRKIMHSTLRGFLLSLPFPLRPFERDFSGRGHKRSH